MSSRPTRLRHVALASTAAGALALTTLGVAPASAAEGPEQLVNGGFTNGTTGWTMYPGTATVDAAGFGCVTVPAKTGPYGAGIGQKVDLIKGETYELSFRAKSTATPTPAAARAIIQGTPTSVPKFEGYDPFLPAQSVAGTTADGTNYRFTFTASADVKGAELWVFQQTAESTADYTFCVDDVSLKGGAEKEVYKPNTGPRVRVNQVGYLRFGPKRATLVTEKTEDTPWRLVNRDGKTVMRGHTAPRGMDESSQQNVHVMDFSRFEGSGTGFTLVADGEKSFPFNIGKGAYERLRVDALSFFYPQRSGVPILGAVAGEEYARPAGHVNSPEEAKEGNPNKGDAGVPCQSIGNQTENDATETEADDADNKPYYPEGLWFCPEGYRLDVTGGWYDAGDHGKYVVNGGISVAQLMSTYERTKTAFSTDRGRLEDGTLRVPEKGNKLPDVLDEARFELEWMMKMQVPAGTAPFKIGTRGEMNLSGMAHHKIHDEKWTGLPLMPHEDPQVRSLHRPSTAATLNLAAVTAQGARLFAPYDPAFANRLLRVSKTAYAAAKRVPDLYAPGADGQEGGGPYNDDNVTDEFYWAAAELYITTGWKRFRDDVVASPHHRTQVFMPEGFQWGRVAALGRLDLATVPNRIPGRRAIQASVLEAADRLVVLQRGEAYGMTYSPTNNEFDWGSNSQVTNNLVVIGTAYDLSGKEKYRRSAIEGMDYLLGRNALNMSYITGYGEQHSRNQHSRWYANQIDPKYPNPPRGSLAGGPNSLEGTWDPIAKEKFGETGCAPAMCYIDHIESWSTNELTINWNSSLAWVASWMADQDRAGLQPIAPVFVDYDKIRQSGNSFSARIRVTNVGVTAIRRQWNISWSYAGNQRVTVFRGGEGAQLGSTVLVLTDLGRLSPGETATIYIKARGTKLAHWDPEMFWVNGKPAGS